MTTDVMFFKSESSLRLTVKRWVMKAGKLAERQGFFYVCFSNSPSINMLRRNFFYVKGLRILPAFVYFPLFSSIVALDGHHLGINFIYSGLYFLSSFFAVLINFPKLRSFSLFSSLVIELYSFSLNSFM